MGFEVFDEFVDSGVGVGEGVGEFDDLGFGLVDFESEPVDGEGGVVVGGVVEEGAAEGGAGGWWWVGGGVGDGFGGGDAVDAVFGFEESVEAAAGAEAAETALPAAEPAAAGECPDWADGAEAEAPGALESWSKTAGRLVPAPASVSQRASSSRA